MQLCQESGTCKNSERWVQRTYFRDWDPFADLSSFGADENNRVLVKLATMSLVSLGRLLFGESPMLSISQTIKKSEQ